MAVPVQAGMKELLNTLKARGVQHPVFDSHIERYKKLRDLGRTHKEAVNAVMTKAGFNRVAGPPAAVVKNDVARVGSTTSDHIAGPLDEPQERELAPIIATAPSTLEPQATVVQMPETPESSKRRKR